MSEQLKPVTSSNIAAAGYSAETETLVVEFRSGAKYKYPNIPLDQWKDFEATFDGTEGRSAGKFFNAKFRDLPCEKDEE